MFRHAAIALALWLVTASAQAERVEQPRQIIVIPKTYVSPAASGSIGGFERYEQREMINGRPLPQIYRRDSIDAGDYRFEQRGSIRQSTEYPGGLRIERYPGGGSYQRHERR